MTDFLSTHWLDIVTTILGLIYLILEYRASIALWVVGIVMPAMDIYLYWSHGLYGDAGMAVYYTLAAIYGYAVWKFGAKWKAMIKRKGSDKKEGASAVSSDKIEAASAVSSSSEDLPITFFLAASSCARSVFSSLPGLPHIMSWWLTPIVRFPCSMLSPTL